MTPGPVAPFPLESVVHLVSPTGDCAHDLEELHEAVARAPERSLFWHVAGRLRREPWCDELPPDDFSAWVGGVVQDRETAERLSYAVQSLRAGPGTLRAALLGALDGVASRPRATRDAPEGGEFAMLTCESVTVPTGLEARDPASLVEALAVADPGAWFYHLVETPWLGGQGPLLPDWLRAQGAERLAAWLGELSESGLPLEAMRRRLLQRRRRSHVRRRVSEAAASPEGERKQAARAAVEGLVRRLRRPRKPA